MLRRSLAVVVCATLVCGAANKGMAEKANIVETAVATGSFETLIAAATAAGLADDLQGAGPFTVFAPTDEAFAKLPEGTVASLLEEENLESLKSILLYHVVSGQVTAEQVMELKGAVTLNGQRVDINTDDGVKVDAATVVQADIFCSNGVIHVIDTVILPASATIPEVATEAGQFGTLLAAAQAAGLVEALSGDGPLTVFAPTDAAFAKLPGGTVATLLRPENRDQLAEILKYHVVSGRVYSEAVVGMDDALTLLGSEIHISVEDCKVMINNATVIATDIDASNGVIHVIDTVLLPPAPVVEEEVSIRVQPSCRSRASNRMANRR